MKKIDAIITPQIIEYMMALGSADISPVIRNLKEKLSATHAKALAAVVKQREAAERDLIEYRALILKAVRGESKFSQDDLAASMEAVRESMSDLERREQSLRGEIAKQEEKIDGLVYLQSIVPDWIDEFNKAETDVKKMMVAQIVDSILIFRDHVEIKYKANIYLAFEGAKEKGGSDEDVEKGSCPIPCEHADAER
jgi:DNA-binding XRE family transcriptional regulator